MTETFNFDQFLMEKGFAFTNYGSHNLYEIEKDEQHFAINLQGQKMTTNDTFKGTLLVDVAVPKDFKSAEKWLNEFFGVKSEEKTEKPTESKKAVTPVEDFVPEIVPKGAIKPKARAKK